MNHLRVAAFFTPAASLSSASGRPARRHSSRSHSFIGNVRRARPPARTARRPRSTTGKRRMRVAVDVARDVPDALVPDVARPVLPVVRLERRVDVRPAELRAPEPQRRRRRASARDQALTCGSYHAPQRARRRRIAGVAADPVRPVDDDHRRRRPGRVAVQRVGEVDLHAVDRQAAQLGAPSARRSALGGACSGRAEPAGGSSPEPGVNRSSRTATMRGP